MLSKNKFFLTCLAAVALSSAAVIDVRAEQEPQEVIISAFEEGMEILKSPELKGEENINKRRVALWQYLKPKFDLTEMSKRALGPRWQNLDEGQREEFIDVFSDVLRNFYLSKIDKASGEKIRFVRKVVRGDRSKVQTVLITGNDKFTLDFSLIRHGDTWRAYDLAVEGVSVISNYRSQLKSLLDKNSFDEVMEQLRKKRKETAIEGLD